MTEALIIMALCLVGLNIIWALCLVVQIIIWAFLGE